MFKTLFTPLSLFESPLPLFIKEVKWDFTTNLQLLLFLARNVEPTNKKILSKKHREGGKKIKAMCAQIFNGVSLELTKKTQQQKF